ncbi:MAG TPA: helix-turn-helix transcriptional regulator [Candidatus Nanoarchaeia archaeon]|nr:helix-turn-helix transcriptional regulator [Candidatus Nanoarchaeia archaeon]
MKKISEDNKNSLFGAIRRLKPAVLRSSLNREFLELKTVGLKSEVLNPPVFNKIELICTLYNKGTRVSEIAKLAGVSYSTTYTYTKLKEMGFDSYHDYKRFNKGFYTSLEDYINEKEKLYDEKAEVAKKRKEFRELIRARLNELGRNQSWLSKQLGVSRKAVSQYVSGELVPRQDLRKKLASSLECKDLEKTIDALTKSS